MFNNLFGFVLEKLPENNRFERIWKLAQIDFRRRYYHDNLGILWSMLNPLFRICVFYLVFKVVMKFERMENYALFIFSGLVFWMVFVEGINKGKMLLYRKRYLIENIQINKIDLYLSNALSNFFSLLITFFIYSLVAYIVGIRYSISIVWILVIIINIYLLSIGGGMILATLYIFFKDINHLWDIIKLFLFWTSGVFLRGEKFLEFFPGFLYLNPMVGIMINIRNLVFFNQSIDLRLMLFCLTYGIIIFLIGNWLFHKNADLAIERY